jgi:hypothetical protein
MLLDRMLLDCARMFRAHLTVFFQLCHHHVAGAPRINGVIDERIVR